MDQCLRLQTHHLLNIISLKAKKLLKHVKFSNLVWSVLIIICETSFVWKILARVVILQFLQVTNSSSLLTGWYFIACYAWCWPINVNGNTLFYYCSNLAFISGLSMWTVMSFIGSTAVNSLELTNFSFLIKDTNSKVAEWTESSSCSHKISLIVPVSSATIVSIYLLHRQLIFHYRCPEI